MCSAYICCSKRKYSLTMSAFKNWRNVNRRFIYLRCKGKNSAYKIYFDLWYIIYDANWNLSDRRFALNRSIKWELRLSSIRIAPVHSGHLSGNTELHFKCMSKSLYICEESNYGNKIFELCRIKCYSSHTAVFIFTNSLKIISNIWWSTESRCRRTYFYFHRCTSNVQQCTIFIFFWNIF